MNRNRLLLVAVSCVLLLSGALPQRTLASALGSTHLQEAPPTTGVMAGPQSTLAASTPETLPDGEVQPVRLVTAKGVRTSDFTPIIETSLFTTTDYAVYAWFHVLTGASYRTLQFKWRFIMPTELRWKISVRGGVSAVRLKPQPG